MVVRRRLAAVVAVAWIGVAAGPAFSAGKAHGPGHVGASRTHHGGASHATHGSPRQPHAPTTSGRAGGSRAAPGVARDSHGRIARSGKARGDFKKAHPCPSTGRTTGACPGYVIDHVHALKRGGADSPANMQWQTKAAARAKDRVE